jgi:hypothetical protein
MTLNFPTLIDLKKITTQKKFFSIILQYLIFTSNFSCSFYINFNIRSRAIYTVDYMFQIVLSGDNKRHFYNDDNDIRYVREIFKEFRFT